MVKNLQIGEKLIRNVVGKNYMCPMNILLNLKRVFDKKKMISTNYKGRGLTILEMLNHRLNMVYLGNSRDLFIMSKKSNRKLIGSKNRKW
jgi:hypothetical protein